MFNRQPFNKGKFNTSASRHRSVYFQGSANIGLEAAGCIVAVRAFEGSAGASLDVGSNINYVRTLRGSADASILANSKLSVISGFKGKTDICLYSYGNVIRACELGVVYEIAANSGFNRLLFNRGRFNVISYKYYKSCNVKINFEAAGNMSTFSTLRGNADLTLLSSGRLNAIMPLEGNVDTKLTASGTMGMVRGLYGNAYMSLEASNTLFTRQRTFNGNMFFVLEVTSKGFNTYRYEYIKLHDLLMKPGDELVINTDEMTVKLNGQNVIQYLSRDSEFFLFNPHENDIIYTSGNANDKVDIKILWKDAFL